MMLEGSYAIATGATHGIGRSIAGLLERECANVVVNARCSGSDRPGSNYEEIDAVVQAIMSTGGNASGVDGPVNDPNVAEKQVQSCVDDYGSIDILVNNAGVLVEYRQVLQVRDCTHYCRRDRGVRGKVGIPITGITAEGDRVAIEASSHAGRKD